MKHAIIILITLFLGFTTVSASNSDKNKKVLCGKVIDKTTGEALTGVKVEIAGTGTYCYSDLSGNFVLSVSTDSKQEVEANIVGYEQVKLKTTELGFNTDINLLQQFKKLLFWHFSQKCLTNARHLFKVVKNPDFHNFETLHSKT